MGLMRIYKSMTFCLKIINSAKNTLSTSIAGQARQRFQNWEIIWQVFTVQISYLTTTPFNTTHVSQPTLITSRRLPGLFLAQPSPVSSHGGRHGKCRSSRLYADGRVCTRIRFKRLDLQPTSGGAGSIRRGRGKVFSVVAEKSIELKTFQSSVWSGDGGAGSKIFSG